MPVRLAAPMMAFFNTPPMVAPARAAHRTPANSIGAKIIVLNAPEPMWLRIPSSRLEPIDEPTARPDEPTPRNAPSTCFLMSSVRTFKEI